MNKKYFCVILIFENNYHSQNYPPQPSKLTEDWRLPIGDCRLEIGD
jgi:hypothetical protein